jgi:hypothetical protein
MKNTFIAFKTLGAKNAEDRFNALEKAGLATQEPTPRNLAALFVAITAPADVDLQVYVIDRMNAVDFYGKSFGETLKELFERQPCDLGVSQITISQDVPLARVSYLVGAVQEFESPDCRPNCIKTEVVFSGGAVSHLSLKLILKTVSGWVGEPHVNE